MRATYDDILALARELKREPLWFDENGVPRFAEHHPHLCANIYATTVVLLEISCQACGTEIRVQMSEYEGELLLRRRLYKGTNPPPTLRDNVKDGTIHYGDPPVHNGVNGEYCHVGCTMNCWDLRVIEFWTRGQTSVEWQREAEIEIALPDLTDTMRTGGA